MILPFTKVFSLCIRLFTRPLVSYAKSAVKVNTKRSEAMRTLLLSSGQVYHRMHYRIQRLFLPTSIAEEYVKPLGEEKALEAGAEFLGEVVVYGVLMIWGVYEMDKTQRESKEKEAEMNVTVTAIREKMQAATASFQAMRLALEEAEKSPIKSP